MRKLLFLTALPFVIVGGVLTANRMNTAPLSPGDQALQKCELHGAKLQIGTASVLYGDRAPIVDMAVARRNFPRARSHILGGCTVTSGSPHLQTVKFCPQCRIAEQSRAEQKWLAEHHLSIPNQ